MSRILVVDHDAAVREALERALRFEGHEELGSDPETTREGSAGGLDASLASE